MNEHTNSPFLYLRLPCIVAEFSEKSNWNPSSAV